MTKEELKQEAEEKADIYFNSLEVDDGNVSDTRFSDYDVFVAYKKGALDFAEPREKRIAELEKENKLIKDSDSLCKLIGEQKIKISELEAQIEKMKCCANCKNEGDYKEPYRYGTGWCNICKRHKVAKGNFDKWELAE